MSKAYQRLNLGRDSSGRPLVEEWRPVVGYEGAYEVSDLGRVRSLDREVYAGPGRTRRHVGRILAIHEDDHYSKVRLKLDGHGETVNVHALVARAFIGPCPSGLEVCHNNGQHHDNRLANLRYDTHSANQLDSVRLGMNPLAARTHCDRGHEFTPENTYLRTGARESGRRCLSCDRAVAVSPATAPAASAGGSDRRRLPDVQGVFRSEAR